MNLAKLLHLLQDEVHPEKDPATKTIIRFHNPDEFAACLLQLHKINDENICKAVKPIRTIKAMVCPLHSPEPFARFSDRLSVEPDYQIRLHAFGFNFLNPFYNQQPPRNFEPEQKIPWGVKRIKAPLVWKRSKGNRVKIGVVDTGVDFRHPDLRACLARGINLFNQYTLPYDDNGHGTHIAGTIAAYNPTSGMTGVAPKAIIYPVKAFDRSGSAFVSDIIMGIDWCVANRMDIINMSFGMKPRSEALLEAVKAAYRSGVIIVSSSGNDGLKGSVDYPARFPQTIAVGASNKQNKIASFTNRGKEIDAYAPGAQIFSTWTAGKYNELSGTSMATSHVTGLIALILAYRPGLSLKKVKRVLKLSSSPVSASKKNPGVGLVNAFHALDLSRKIAAAAKSGKRANRR
ncbi:MAG TPA: S8 family peptidase [Bacilli bacterium]